MMMTAIAISPMMRNVLSAATMPLAAVRASDTAAIALRIVPMIRPMSPVCAQDLWQATVVPADPAMRSLRGTPRAENVSAAREAVATLRATTTEHLDHEEAELEPFYLEHAHTPEMKAMGRAFGREYKPAEAGTYFAWLQDGASRDELAGLRQNVPGPVVAIIGAVFGGSYRRTIAPAWRAGRAP